MHLSNNTLLHGGRYKIVRFISSGGFGSTYEAEHVMLHKRVAIKEFFVKDFCNRDEQSNQITIGITSKSALVEKLKKKFIAEAQALCSLEHPNIVHVFDVFEDNGTAYYVMDYIDGASLGELIKKNGPMKEAQALHYIKQVADALRYVHSQNRLHLDIKPGNIMVDDKDRAILIDFGASKQYDEEGGENTSTLLGMTPGYAPLEQVGNDVVKFLPSTDIYALGATLYKILTGITPPSASLLASGEKLEDVPSSISVSTCNAINQSLQINKLKRPQTIDDFFALLSDKSEKSIKTNKSEDEKTITLEEAASSTPTNKRQDSKSHKTDNEQTESSTKQAGVSKPEMDKKIPTYYNRAVKHFVWLQSFVIMALMVTCIVLLFAGSKATRNLLRVDEIILIVTLLGMLWSTICIKKKNLYRWTFFVWDAIIIAVLLIGCIDYHILSTKLNYEGGSALYRNIRYIGYCCKYETSLVVAVFGPLYILHNVLVLTVMYSRYIKRKFIR